jgi:hypothetical protein
MTSSGIEPATLKKQNNSAPGLFRFRIHSLYVDTRYFRHLDGCLGGLIGSSHGLCPYTENNSKTQTTIQAAFKDFMRLTPHGEVLISFTFG